MLDAKFVLLVQMLAEVQKGCDCRIQTLTRSSKTQHTLARTTRDSGTLSLFDLKAF